jgi:predicted permease
LQPIWHFLFRRRIYTDLSEEIEQHFEEKIDALVAEGISREDAERRARRDFGNPILLEQRSRDVWQLPGIETFLEDLRFGMRILIRKPAFSAIVILLLSLGIGANTAIFSLVSAVLLKPLPYKDSDRLVVVWQTSDQHRSTGEWFDTYREFEIWRLYSHSFEKLAALSWATAPQSFAWHGRNRSVLAIPASVDLFAMLGVAAERGRTFQPADLKEGCTIVVSHSFWQNELGAPFDLVGQSIAMDHTTCRVVGIMPKDFSFYPTQTDVWTLITPESRFAKDPWRSMTGVFGRLRPGTSRAGAVSELEILERNVLPEAPRDLALPRSEPVVLDLQSEFTWLAGRNLRTALIVLFAAVFAILLIACVNVANLLLGQAVDRQKELAIRTSLGSGRRRLIRQLMTESLLLSAGGASGGILLAYLAVHVFRSTNPVELPPGNPVQLDARVLAFTLVLAVLTTALFGFIPAWRASRLNPNEVLKESGQSCSASRGAHRVGSIFVIVEVALSLILLAGAGLLIQSLARLSSAPLGFRTDHLLTGTIRLPETKNQQPDDRRQTFDRIASKAASLPGVEKVALASSFYLMGSNVVSVEGRSVSPENAPYNVADQTIDNNFFRVMEVPILRGRAFDARDRGDTQPVAIINQALAHEYFPNQDPIGREIKLGRPEETGVPWLTIIGIAANVRTTTVFEEMGYVTVPAVYRPFTQQPAAFMSIFIRTHSNPRAIDNALQQQVLSVDSDIILTDMKTMEERISQLQKQPRFRTVLFSIFAAVALVLALLGVYGMLNQSVIRHTREIGIRMALGASRSSIIRMILGQALKVVLIGTALGLIASLVLARLFAALLYGAKQGDVGTLIAVSVFLVGVSALASYLPARRATHIDPLRAVRAD